MLILICLVIPDLYLFFLTVILNPVFNCSNNLLSSSVDRVTTGTNNIVSVTLNVAFEGLLISDIAGSTPGLASVVALLVITQLSDQVKIRFISQLINSVCSTFQKLLRYFNGTAISTSFSVLLPSNPPVMIAL